MTTEVATSPRITHEQAAELYARRLADEDRFRALVSGEGVTLEAVQLLLDHALMLRTERERARQAGRPYQIEPASWRPELVELHVWGEIGLGELAVGLKAEGYSPDDAALLSALADAERRDLEAQLGRLDATARVRHSRPLAG